MMVMDVASEGVAREDPQETLYADDLCILADSKEQL